MQIDKDIPIPIRGKQKDPQKVQIARSLEIGYSIKFESQKEMEGFRRYVVDLYGNGSCTCRRLPNNRGGYEFRLWRTK